MTAIRSEIRRITQHGSPAFNCTVTVESVTPLSTGFRRVAVFGDGLDAYGDVLPADAFKIMIPRDGEVVLPERGADKIPYWKDGRQPVLRAFTVRHFDRARRRIEFDAMVHEGGATESLEPGTQATVYLAADHDDDRALLSTKDGVTVHWVTGGSPTGPGSPLETAVCEREQRGGRIQAWLAAEATVVRELRRFAVHELAVIHDDLHAAAYWKAGVNSTDMDTVYLERYGREIASGADASDPDVREKVELEA